jgi:hypothetical protein
MGQISEKKTGFHDNVLLSSAVKDSLGSARGGRPIYKEGAKGVKKDAFGEALRSELRELAKQYSGRDVDDETHIQNIGGLASRLKHAHEEILKDGVLKFGVAAKALNVYLKHLWCGKPDLDIRPTHCPFDNNIIERLGLPEGYENRWTYAEEKDYREWVRRARTAAEGDGHSTLSDWELDKWQS